MTPPNSQTDTRADSQAETLAGTETDSPTERAELLRIGASLRAIRRQKGLTLRDVERQSEGKWKAVVVGSYERADRALTLKRATGLSAFYNVPLDQLLGLVRQSPREDSYPRLILNLTEIRRRKADLPGALLRYLHEICRMRADWNGEVLTLRAGDITTLGVILDIASENVLPWATSHNFTIIR
jgi:transcriptional regulator with XRE-family HTH domain